MLNSPENLTQPEAHLVLANEVVHGGHPTEQIAKALYGVYWKTHYLPNLLGQSHEILSNPARGLLLISSINQAFDGAKSFPSRLRDTEKYEQATRLRFGIELGRILTLAEVGNILGLGVEGVRQINLRMLRRLRHPMNARWIKANFEINQS